MIFQLHTSSNAGDRADEIEVGFLDVEEIDPDARNWMSLNSSSSSSSSSSSLSSSDYERCLRFHHLELVNGVDATHIVDYLFQAELLNVDDIQEIPSSPIQSVRMRSLLTVIHRRLHSHPPEAVFHHFLISLSADYPFVEGKLRCTLDQLRMRNFSRPSGDCTTRDLDGHQPPDGVSSLSESVAVVDADPGISCQVVEGVDARRNAIEEMEETIPFPVMESTAEPNDAKSIVQPSPPSECMHQSKFGQPTPPSECMRQNKYGQLSPSSECMRENKSSQLSPSSECMRQNKFYQILPPSECFRLNKPGRPSSEEWQKHQVEMIRRLRKTEFLHEFPERQLCVNTPSATFVPLSMPPSNHGRKFKSSFHRNLFDSLSSSVNDQDFDGYDLAKVKYTSTADLDPDALCLILYLDACKCVIQSDFAACKQTISDSLDVATLASNPNRFYVMYLSVRIWVNLKRRRLAKARSALGDALNVIGQDPVTCSGMTAGWIYVDEAKLVTASMTSSPRHAQSNRRRAIGAMERALEQFRLDESADGPYGRNFASVKMASLLVACDDHLTWMEVLEPTDADLAKADELLESVDDSVTGICSILKPLFLVAQSDRKFRSGKLRRAVELARDAADLASRKGLKEEEELARLRATRYGRMIVGRGVAAATLDLLPDVLSSSDGEADWEEEDTGDERGSKRSQRGGEGGGCRLRKCRRRRRKRRKMTCPVSSLDPRKHLSDNVNHRVLCLPWLLPLLLIIALLLLTVATLLFGSAVSSWGQTDFGPPVGPMIGRMAPSR